MKFRLTVVAMALSVLVIGPVYAGGAGGCAFDSKYRYTSVEPQEQSEAARKLASLSLPASEQETAGQAAKSVPEKTDASTSPDAESATAQ